MREPGTTPRYEPTALDWLLIGCAFAAAGLIVLVLAWGVGLL